MRALPPQIARRLGLSRTTVQSRIEKLEQRGVISGYTVRVHDEVEQALIRAHIMITVLPRHTPAVVKALQALPQVRTCIWSAAPMTWVAIGAAPTVGEIDVLTGPHRRHRRSGAHHQLDHPVHQGFER